MTIAKFQAATFSVVSALFVASLFITSAVGPAVHIVA